MTVYERISRQARTFAKSYPKELPARLEWWGQALGIDRVRLLRMIGLSVREAALRKDDDLKEIVEDPEWADNALGLEGLLSLLLSLYQYDWHTLAGNIRKAAATRRGEASPAAGEEGAIQRLHARRNGKMSDVWVGRIHEGGDRGAHLAHQLPCRIPG